LTHKAKGHNLQMTNNPYMSGNPNKLSQFWQELKRRNVVRVITVYAGVAFVILELVEILAASMGYRESMLRY
jgi:hypothetical protein